MMGDTKKLELQDQSKFMNGKLDLGDLKLHMRSSLIAYLRKGWSISVSIAIDFSLSNLEISNPNSLHYKKKDGTGEDNQYEKALQ